MILAERHFSHGRLCLGSTVREPICDHSAAGRGFGSGRVVQTCCGLLWPVWRPYTGAPATRQTALKLWLGSPDLQN